MTVYFIQCNEFVKIGDTSNIEERFKSLQASNPYKLELLCCIDDCTEKEFHEKFKNERIHGEWFKISGILKDFIMEKNWQFFVSFILTNYI
ncbi:hypothetical protein LCGC14_2741700 [marine sediment metagenome]|uniref:Uncharacterized protein n=1 Tax=marine sediment metagenome TaxID=412755 RepID=A0A0F9BD51_9ZZZZ